MNPSVNQSTRPNPLCRVDSGSKDLYRELQKLLLDLDLKLEDVAAATGEPAGTIFWAFIRGKSERAAACRRTVTKYLAPLQKRLVAA